MRNPLLAVFPLLHFFQKLMNIYSPAILSYHLVVGGFLSPFSIKAIDQNGPQQVICHLVRMVYEISVDGRMSTGGSTDDHINVNSVEGECRSLIDLPPHAGVPWSHWSDGYAEADNNNAGRAVVDLPNVVQNGGRQRRNNERYFQR